MFHQRAQKWSLHASPLASACFIIKLDCFYAAANVYDEFNVINMVSELTWNHRCGFSCTLVYHQRLTLQGKQGQTFDLCTDEHGFSVPKLLLSLQNDAI